MKPKRKKNLFYTFLIITIASVAILLSTKDITELKLDGLVAGMANGSTNYYSASNGNWNSKSSWQGSKPSTTIDVGDTVFINHDITFPSDLNVYGVLIIANDMILSNNGNKNVSINNQGTIIIYGELDCVDLTISGGGTLISYGYVNVDGDLNNSGNLHIETTDSTTGGIIVNGSSSGSRYIQFKRNISSNGWHYVSSPVENSTSNIFSGAALYSYNEPSKSWTPHYSNDTLESFKGYDVYFKTANKTVVFEGNYNDGNFTQILTNTNTTGDGYNLCGNPYPSAIDWDASGWTKTNVDNAIYLWDPETQNIASYISGVGANGGSNIIPPTMAFFIKCNSYSGGSLSISNEVKISTIENFRSNQPDNFISLSISGNQYNDESLIRLINTASFEFDSEYDAEKMFSFNTQIPQIYTKTSGDKPLSINSIALFSEEVSIPIYVSIKVKNTYFIGCNLSELNFAYDVFIEDLKTGNTFDSKNGKYEFESDVIVEEKRFVLHLIPVQTIDFSTGIDENSVQKAFNLYTNKNTLIVESNIPPKDAVLTVYSLNGTQILTETLRDQIQSRILLPYSSGIYIVKVTSTNMEETHKVIIN